MSKRSKGSYIGGATVITVRHSDKRMTERQAHWRRKLGYDQIVPLRGVVDDGSRLIKRSEMQQATPSTPTPVRSDEPPSSGYGVEPTGKRGKSVRRMLRNGTLPFRRIEPVNGV